MNSSTQNVAISDYRFYRTYNGPIKIQESNDFLEFQREFIQNKKNLDEEICKSEEKYETNSKKKNDEPLNLKLVSASGKDFSQTSNLIAKKFIGQMKKIANLNQYISSNALILLNDFSHFNIVKKNIDKNKKILGIFYWLVKLFQKSVFESMMVNVYERLKRIETFHPFNKFKIAWDIFLCLNTLFMFFYLPWILSFEIVAEKTKFYFNSIQIAIYFFAILNDMNTGYIKDGVLTKKRKKLWKNYFKNFFVFDLMAILALIFGKYEFFNKDNKNYLLFIVRFLFFVKIKAFYASFSRIKEFLLLSLKSKGNFLFL